MAYKLEPYRGGKLIRFGWPIIVRPLAFFSYRAVLGPMNFPLRFVATTYNLWTDMRWPEREEPLRAFLRASEPDILCLQELTRFTRQVLDEELPRHQRVHDPLAGWETEGNIYWSKALFELVEYGAEDIGLVINPERRLFWVRLKLKGRPETLFVATAHYTWQANPRERAEGMSPRVEEARRTVEELDRLAPDGEAVLFMGDLNDSINPIYRLRDAGLRDCFTAAGLSPRPTHPVPSMATGTPQTLDWQFFRGPLRVMNADAVDFFLGSLAPSDHLPVTATYGWDLPN